MTDSRLRDLEQQYKRLGTKDAEAAFDVERVRLGVAVETGFLQRREEEWSTYRSRVRVHFSEASRDFSLWKIFPQLGRGSTHQVKDIGFAEGQLHIVTFGPFGTHGFDIYHHRVSVEGSVETKVLNSLESVGRYVVKVLNVGGRLGVVEPHGQGNVVFVDGILVHQVERSLVFDYSNGTGFVQCTSQSEGIFVSSSGGGQCVHWPPLTPKKTERGVFVQEGLVSPGINEGSNRRIRDECGLNGYAGFAIPKESRLVQKRFVASSKGELERYYSMPPGEVVRVIQEVPRKNLEGLIIAVERASHKRVKK